MKKWLIVPFSFTSLLSARETVYDWCDALPPYARSQVALEEELEPSSSASAALSKEESVSPCFIETDALDKEDPCFRGHVTLLNREGGGIGYSPGYTSLDFFWINLIPPKPGGDRYVFLDLRGHYFNNGKWGANGGFGFRIIPSYSKTILGGNFFLDWKQVDRDSFQQIGAGLEAIFSDWDVHLNGYFPFGSRKGNPHRGFSHFKGHEAWFYEKSKRVLTGVDLTLGYSLKKFIGFGAHAGLTGYYFEGQGGQQFGGALFKTRLNIKAFSLEGQVSYDTHFKWIAQAEIGLKLKFGTTCCSKDLVPKGCDTLLKQETLLTERVDRFEIPVTLTEKQKAIALNPATKDPLTFYFVNPLNQGKIQDGSFDSPFLLFSEGVSAWNPGDALYVFPTGGDPYPYIGTAIVFQDNQILAGSGAPLPLQSRFGAVTIPAQTSDTAAFLLPGSNVTFGFLANSNLISGVNIIQSGVNNICFNQLANTVIINFTCLNNIITEFPGHVMTLFDVRGKFLVEGNTFSCLNSPHFPPIAVDLLQGECTFIHNSFIGINPISINGFIGNFVAKDNFFQAAQLTSPYTAVEINTAVGNFTFQNNIFSGDSQGGQVLSFIETTGNIVYEGNTSSFLQMNPIADTAPQAILVRNNLLENNDNNPALALAVNTSVEITNEIVQNNRVTSPLATSAAASVSAGTGLILLRFTKNSASAPLGSSDTALTLLGSGPLQVQSPNLQLSGVQEMNQGRILESGVDFVFFR